MAIPRPNLIPQSISDWEILRNCSPNEWENIIQEAHPEGLEERVDDVILDCLREHICEIPGTDLEGRVQAYASTLPEGIDILFWSSIESAYEFAIHELQYEIQNKDVSDWAHLFQENPRGLLEAILRTLRSPDFTPQFARNAAEYLHVYDWRRASLTQLLVFPDVFHAFIQSPRFKELPKYGAEASSAYCSASMRFQAEILNSSPIGLAHPCLDPQLFFQQIHQAVFIDGNPQAIEALQRCIERTQTITTAGVYLLFLLLNNGGCLDENRRPINVESSLLNSIRSNDKLNEILILLNLPEEERNESFFMHYPYPIAALLIGLVSTVDPFDFLNREVDEGQKPLQQQRAIEGLLAERVNPTRAVVQRYLSLPCDVLSAQVDGQNILQILYDLERYPLLEAVITCIKEEFPADPRAKEALDHFYLSLNGFPRRSFLYDLINNWIKTAPFESPKELVHYVRTHRLTPMLVESEECGKMFRLAEQRSLTLFEQSLIEFFLQKTEERLQTNLINLLRDMNPFVPGKLFTQLAKRCFSELDPDYAFREIHNFSGKELYHAALLLALQLKVVEFSEGTWVVNDSVILERYPYLKPILLPLKMSSEEFALNVDPSLWDLYAQHCNISPLSLSYGVDLSISAVRARFETYVAHHLTNPEHLEAWMTRLNIKPDTLLPSTGKALIHHYTENLNPDLLAELARAPHVNWSTFDREGSAPFAYLFKNGMKRETDEWNNCFDVYLGNRNFNPNHPFYASDPTSVPILILIRMEISRDSFHDFSNGRAAGVYSPLFELFTKRSVFPKADLNASIEINGKSVRPLQYLNQRMFQQCLGDNSIRNRSICNHYFYLFTDLCSAGADPFLDPPNVFQLSLLNECAFLGAPHPLVPYNPVQLSLAVNQLPDIPDEHKANLARLAEICASEERPSEQRELALQAIQQSYSPALFNLIIFNDISRITNAAIQELGVDYYPEIQDHQLFFLLGDPAEREVLLENLQHLNSDQLIQIASFLSQCMSDDQALDLIQTLSPEQATTFLNNLGSRARTLRQKLSLRAREFVIQERDLFTDLVTKVDAGLKDGTTQGALASIMLLSNAKRSLRKVDLHLQYIPKSSTKKRELDGWKADLEEKIQEALALFTEWETQKLPLAILELIDLIKPSTVFPLTTPKALNHIAQGPKIDNMEALLSLYRELQHQMERDANLYHTEYPTSPVASPTTTPVGSPSHPLRQRIASPLGSPQRLSFGSPIGSLEEAEIQIGSLSPTASTVTDAFLTGVQQGALFSNDDGSFATPPTTPTFNATRSPSRPVRTSPIAPHSPFMAIMRRRRPALSPEGSRPKKRSRTLTPEERIENSLREGAQALANAVQEFVSAQLAAEGASFEGAMRKFSEADICGLLGEIFKDTPGVATKFEAVVGKSLQEAYVGGFDRGESLIQIGAGPELLLLFRYSPESPDEAFAERRALLTEKIEATTEGEIRTELEALRTALETIPGSEAEMMDLQRRMQIALIRHHFAA